MASFGQGMSQNTDQKQTDAQEAADYLRLINNIRKWTNMSSQQGGMSFQNPFAAWGSGGNLGMSNWAGGATPLVYAYLIGKGKLMTQRRLEKNPNDPLGNFGLAMLAPSISQIAKDPKGMGIPTAIGLPFLTPFTASKKAKQTKPEWEGIFGGLF